MKRNSAAIACLLTAISIGPAKAQVVLDLSLITCRQLLESDPERQALIGSWMSGYFSATKNLKCLTSVMSSEIERWSAITARRTSQIQ